MYAVRLLIVMLVGAEAERRQILQKVSAVINSYVGGCRGRATADFTESESEAGVMLRRRRRRNRSTETLTYAADGCWDGSQSTLCRCTHHAAGFVVCVYCSVVMHTFLSSCCKMMVLSSH